MALGGLCLLVEEEVWGDRVDKVQGQEEGVERLLYDDKIQGRQENFSKSLQKQVHEAISREQAPLAKMSEMSIRNEHIFCG